MAGTGCGIQAPIEGRKNQNAGKYHPVGTGPYKLDRFVKDDYLTMNVNTEYWQRTPDIEKIIWRSIPESSTRIANLLTGDVDVTLSVPPQDWPRINSNVNTSIYEYLTTRVNKFAILVELSGIDLQIIFSISGVLCQYSVLTFIVK
jgi:ABC-type transport system substrate-binding protein